MKEKTIFGELEIVELAHNISKYSLNEGERGTVVEVYKNGKGYEVEFIAPDGRTKALLTLMPEDIRFVKYPDPFVYFGTSTYTLSDVLGGGAYYGLTFGTETKSAEDKEEFHYPISYL